MVEGNQKDGEKMKFSKKGDRGFTSLLGGQRIPKAGPRPEAYGTLDEASSALGIARALAVRPKTKEMILSVQRDLGLLCGELATASEDLAKSPCRMTSEHVDRLERLMEDLQENLEISPEFICPGDSVSSAAIDLGRTIVRRAERKAVGLIQQKQIHNIEVLRYLNRLADLLFVLARYEESPAP